MGEALDVGASMIRSVLHQTDLTVSRELAFAHALMATAGHQRFCMPCAAAPPNACCATLAVRCWQ